MNNEKQKPETLPEAIDLQPLDLPPGRKLLTFRSVQVMFHHAIKAGLARKDGAEMLRPDAFDVTDTDGRTLSMNVARSVDTAAGEDGSGTYSIECRTVDEESGVIRALKVERDDATSSYDVSFGSSDELAEATNVHATEKVAMHLTEAESILLSALGEEADDTGDDDKHLAAAHAILGAAMYGGGPREVTVEKPQATDAPVIDLATERMHRRL